MVNTWFPMVTIITKNILNNFFLQKRNVVPEICPGRYSHMKGAGMLVVSLRRVIFGFWSHLGCSGQNAIIFSRQGIV